MVLNEVLVHFVCNIFVCTCPVVGGGCGIHVSNDEGGTVFDYIDNGFYLSLHLKPEGQLSMIRRFESAVFRMTEVFYPPGPSVRVSNSLPEQCILCVHRQLHHRL